MSTPEGSKKLAKVLIGAIICLMLLAVFLAMEAREERHKAEATKLAKQYVGERSELYREQDECDTEDFCCIERSSLRRRILSLEFESECYPKFGKDECDYAFLRAPEFDFAGII